ncbi:MAG: polymer-forming cytoskeletal protein [Anaerolineae bacterium]|nr:polymer-forming cytoskeletal protein [Anaerolineae bacterium]
MSKLKKMGFVLILAIVFAALSVPVLADGPEGDVVIWGDNYTLGKDQKIDGELLVYGGNVKLEEDSEVDGNVSVFGGNLDIYGEVDGDVTVWGGNVRIHDGATVRGGVMAVGGNLTRDPDADIRGSEVEGFPFEMPRVPEAPALPEMPRVPSVPDIRVRHSRPWEGFVSNVGNLFRSIFGLVVLVVLGILVVVFIPQHTDTVAETMVKAPFHSMISGGVALIAVPVVAVVLAITVCLIPVSALLALVLGIGLLFGWIAAGLLFGTRILRALNKKEPNRVTAVAVGLPILSVLSLVPCIGWAISLVLWTWGLGAVAYSFFGTRAYNEPMPKFSKATKADAEDYDPRMDRL